jgi:hypothetical protein
MAREPPSISHRSKVIPLERAFDWFRYSRAGLQESSIASYPPLNNYQIISGHDPPHLKYKFATTYYQEKKATFLMLKKKLELPFTNT